MLKWSNRRRLCFPDVRKYNPSYNKLEFSLKGPKDQRDKATGSCGWKERWSVTDSKTKRPRAKKNWEGKTRGVLLRDRKLQPGVGKKKKTTHTKKGKHLMKGESVFGSRWRRDEGGDGEYDRGVERDRESDGPEKSVIAAGGEWWREVVWVSRGGEGGRGRFAGPSPGLSVKMEWGGLISFAHVTPNLTSSSSSSSSLFLPICLPLLTLPFLSLQLLPSLSSVCPKIYFIPWKGEKKKRRGKYENLCSWISIVLLLLLLLGAVVNRQSASTLLQRNDNL